MMDRARCLPTAIHVVALWVFLATLVVAETAEAKSPQAGARLATECATCHEDLVKAFDSTRHGKADRFGVGGFSESCGSCHTGAAEHASSGDPTKVSNLAKARPADASKACLTCHANQHAQSFWMGSAHETSKVSCLGCHSIHNAKAGKLLAKRSENETCLTCHTSLRKAQLQRSTHLFRDERLNSRISCTSCHAPHGSQAPKMVKANSVNDTCYICHTEMRGPFLWQHSPVQENCVTCHTPHGSNNPKLLAVRTTQLCQSCHMQGRHQTVAGRPNSAWVFNRSCLNCHSQIHGSNHPSGPVLQR